jgi:hypothetical protein
MRVVLMLAMAGAQAALVAPVVYEIDPAHTCPQVSRPIKPVVSLLGFDMKVALHKQVEAIRAK